MYDQLMHQITPKSYIKYYKKGQSSHLCFTNGKESNLS